MLHAVSPVVSYRPSLRFGAQWLATVPLPWQQGERQGLVPAQLWRAERRDQMALKKLYASWRQGNPRSPSAMMLATTRIMDTISIILSPWRSMLGLSLIPPSPWQNHYLLTVGDTASAKGPPTGGKVVAALQTQPQAGSQPFKIPDLLQIGALEVAPWNRKARPGEQGRFSQVAETLLQAVLPQYSDKGVLFKALGPALERRFSQWAGGPPEGRFVFKYFTPAQIQQALARNPLPQSPTFDTELTAQARAAVSGKPSFLNFGR